MIRYDTGGVNMKKAITVTLEEETLEELDNLSEILQLNRSQTVDKLLQGVLLGEQKPLFKAMVEALKESKSKKKTEVDFALV